MQCCNALEKTFLMKNDIANLCKLLQISLNIKCEFMFYWILSSADTNAILCT